MSFEVPSNLVKASKVLCRTLLDAAGGSSAIANSLDWDRQYINQCHDKGYVPNKRVYAVAKLIGVSPWSLNYHRFLESFGEEAPAFEKVVKDTALLPAEKNEILEILK